MLNLKKVIASVCVIAMVLTTVAFGATYSDVTEDSVYYEAVETLTKLDIVEGFDGEYRPEDGVTRAEMAALIARIQGYGDTAKAAANTTFTDVPSSHWASGYIASAAGMGIINGYGDGTFGPEDPVLYEQAVKMIMATLGYTPFAEKNGGYPAGYLAAAQRYDVSLAVANAAVGQEANRGTIAQLLVNAIDTPLMIQSRWSNTGEVDYVIADGSTDDYPYQTLMSANLGYVKIRGILEANSVTSIGGTPTIDTTKAAAVTIKVEDDYKSSNSTWKKDKPVTSFLVNGTDAEDYLGQSVIAYVEKVGNDWAIVSIAVDTARNEELIISLDNYASGGASGTVLKYYKDGANDTTDAKIHTNDSDYNDFTVVVNNEYVGTSVATAVAGKLKYGGQIRLIDNNEKSGYDVAIIDIAYTAVVDEVTSKKIVTKSSALPGGDIKYDLEDENKVLKIMKDGEEIDVTDLVEYDVLSIYANSKNSNYILIEVIGSTVVGTITSSKSSSTSAYPAGAGNGMAYKVDDTWYDVADGAYKASDLAVGEGGTLYIDQFDKIAAFIEDSALAGGAAANYAYVIAVAGEKSGFGSVEASLQLLTSDGVVVKTLASNAALELAAGIAINDAGDSVTAGSKDVKLDIDTDWDPSTGSDTKAMELNDAGWAQYKKIKDMETSVIQYTANSNGYITKITEAGYDADFAREFSNLTTAEFDAARNKFGSQKVESDAIVFVKGSTIDKYAVTTLDAFVDEETYDILLGYKDKKSDTANVIVVADTELSTAASSNIAVVIEAGSTTDENGDKVYEITYFIDGEEVTSVTDADVASNRNIPTAGDILKINLTDGVITTLEYAYDLYTTLILSEKVNAPLTGAYLASGLEKIYGGLVTGCDEDYKISFASVTGSEGDVSLTGAVNNKYIDEAKNVYVVENGRNGIIVDTGSYRDFGYFEYLFKDAAVKLYFTDDSTSDTTIANSAKVAYGDYVYVREYDGDIIDVVIVKGMLDDVERVSDASTFTLTYDANGGSDAPTAVANIVDGSTVTVAAEGTMTNSTNTFLGWATSNSATTADYVAGDSIRITADTTLYAVWEEAAGGAGGGAAE